MNPLDTIRHGVKSVMRSVARALNKLSGGKLTPNQITYTGFIMHIPIALLIGTGHVLLAALLLIFFGLFDTLDGELARLQNSTSPLGMFIDSSTDRIKEIFLYCGIVALLFNTHKYVVIATVAALGASLCTSYLNAWGEAVLANSKDKQTHETNKSFRSGLLGFDIRMVLIIIGLLTNKLEVIIYIILILAIATVFQRFLNITGRLKHV